MQIGSENYWAIPASILLRSRSDEISRPLDARSPRSISKLSFHWNRNPTRSRLFVHADQLGEFARAYPIAFQGNFAREAEKRGFFFVTLASTAVWLAPAMQIRDLLPYSLPRFVVGWSVTLTNYWRMHSDGRDRLMSQKTKPSRKVHRSDRAHHRNDDNGGIFCRIFINTLNAYIKFDHCSLGYSVLQ